MSTYYATKYLTTTDVDVQLSSPSANYGQTNNRHYVNSLVTLNCSETVSKRVFIKKKYVGKELAIILVSSKQL